MKDELNRLASELRRRLPEHTYKAVIGRAQRLDSDAARLDLLDGILAERERSEEA